jgi:hypothetical protein
LTAGILRPLLANLIPSPIKTGRSLSLGTSGAGKTLKNQATPKGGQKVNQNRLAVKKIEEPVLEYLFQA